MLQTLCKPDVSPKSRGFRAVVSCQHRDMLLALNSAVMMLWHGVSRAAKQGTRSSSDFIPDDEGQADPRQAVF